METRSYNRKLRELYIKFHMKYLTKTFTVDS